MNRILLATLLCASLGCISQETIDLSRTIARSTAKQEVALKKLIDERGIDKAESSVAELIQRSEKLRESTEGLADLLGADK